MPGFGNAPCWVPIVFFVLVAIRYGISELKGGINSRKSNSPAGRINSELQRITHIQRQRDRAWDKMRARQNRRYWWEEHWWKVVLIVLLIGGIIYGFYYFSDSQRHSRAMSTDNRENSGETALMLSEFIELAESNPKMMYSFADSLEESGNLDDAALAFFSLGEYGDSETRNLRIRLANFAYGGTCISDKLEMKFKWSLTSLTWDQADAWANSLGDDWRLPTCNELSEIRNLFMEINPNTFDFPEDLVIFWSSEVGQRNPSAQAIYFGGIQMDSWDDNIRPGSAVWMQQSSGILCIAVCPM